MKIFIPFTLLRQQTYLSAPNAKLVPLVNRYSYSKYFKERWRDKETFINIEHDVVPTPDILKSMWDCVSELCVAGYSSKLQVARGTAFTGCAKISASIIERNSGLFNEPCDWIECEGRIAKASNEQFCYHGEVLHLKCL